jgi:hypothetical protein
MEYDKLHVQYKEKTIQGRYLILETIAKFVDSWEIKNRWQIIGQSVQDRPIYKCQIGSGKIKILIWSQMHGNESTTTKGLIDFLNLLQGDSEIAKVVLKTYSFYVIPMLNPDGAEVYTRVNANEVDLNRDFQNLTQPESQLLMHCFKDFKPHYCYNLHDQRTIFGVGAAGKPATISFLAPAFNDIKAYDDNRLKSVESIMNMVAVLQRLIPGQIGRFDDGFNINCAGDTFQSLKTPTILIEAGHFPHDYEREETRKYVFIALLSAFYSSNENYTVDDTLSDYLRIPQNIPNYFDFVYKNVTIKYDYSSFITNFALQFSEVLVGNKIQFNGFVAKVGSLDDFHGHQEYDCEEAIYTSDEGGVPILDEKASFSLNKNVKFVNGLIKKQ